MVKKVKFSRDPSLFAKRIMDSIIGNEDIKKPSIKRAKKKKVANKNR